jgi:hypothetical protein
MILDPILLSKERIQKYADALDNMPDGGRPSINCFGFIDGTFRRIAHPVGHSDNQLFVLAKFCQFFALGKVSFVNNFYLKTEIVIQIVKTVFNGLTSPSFLFRTI